MCMICFVSQCTQSELDIDSVRSILSEYRIANADITLRYDANADDLIDVIEGNRQVGLIENMRKITLAGQVSKIMNFSPF